MVESDSTSPGQLIGPDFIVKSLVPHIETVIGLTVPEFVWKDLNEKENLPALECAETGRKLTHGDVYRQSRSFAASLIKSGFKHNDVICVLLPNIPEYAVVLFGIWEAGCTVSPTSTAYTAEELARQVATSEAKSIITIPAFLPAINVAKKSCPKLNSIIVIGEPQEGCRSYADMIKEDTAGVEFLKGSQIDTKQFVASLPFSSGTTGIPKGVELTHSNLCSNLAQITTPDYGLSKRLDGTEERLMVILPFFHAYGLMVILINHHLGTRMLCVPKFSPVTFPKYFKSFKPTIVPLVPPLISFIVSTPELTPEDFDSVDCIQSGAAPISSAICDKLLTKAEKFLFFQDMYGLTETSPGALISTRSRGNTKPGSCGTLVPGTLGKVVDATGKSLKPRVRGEICIKGPQVMKGYLRNEEATKAVIDSEGWFHTGDIGYYDEDGSFYIVDRLKELIKVNALQVAPAELENELRKLPGILDVAVIGIPDARCGELPRAYIVRKSDALTETAVNEYLDGKVAKYKELKGGIEFVDAIPKALSGKILRRVLKSDYMSKYGERNP